MKEIFINKYPISTDLLLRSDPMKIIQKGNMFEVSHIHRDQVFMRAIDDIHGDGKEININLPINTVLFSFEQKLLDD